MKAKTLVKLAARNDRLLAQYSERWARENKTVNPVGTAIWIFKARLFGWPLVAFCTVINMVTLQYDLGPWSMLPLAPIVCMACVAIFEIKNYHSMLDFCRAISIMEEELGSFEMAPSMVTDAACIALAQWTQETFVAKRAEKILKAKAKEVDAFQSIPWRKSEAAKRRTELEALLTLMKGVASVEQNIGFYFRNQD